MLKLPKGEVTVRDADRRFGYFFCVSWDHPTSSTYSIEDSHAKCVFDPTHRLEVGFILSEKQPPEFSAPQCLSYPDIPHFMIQHHDSVIVEWQSSDPDDFDVPDKSLREGLIYCHETAYHFIGRPLLETLNGNGLTGLVVSRVSQQRGEHHSNWLSDDEIVMIDGARSPIAPMTILPEEANRCEHCGHAPLLCPGCGKIKLDDWDSSSLCPKCGKTWQFGPDATEPQLRRMRIQDADPFPVSFVDMARWDGSDFNMGMLVTARVVDLLERLKCGSFRAQPVAVDVSGLSDEQWKLLDASREPC